MKEEIAEWRIPERVRLENQWVRLTPIDSEEQYEGLFECIADYPDSFTYLPFGPFENKDSLGNFYKTLQAAAPVGHDPPWISFAVQPTEKSGIVGSLSIINIYPEHGDAEIGSVWYSPEVRGSEVNSASVLALCGYLFDDLKYRRVVWKCDNNNEASKAAALALGFTWEGQFRNHRMVRGKNRDTAWFSIIDIEWAERKSELERRITKKCR